MKMSGFAECRVAGYRLRVASPSDVDTILGIDRSHMKEEVENHYRWDEENARQIVADNLERARLLMFQDQVVGVYYWWIEGADLAVLHSIQVASGHRNKGLGKWMMECFESEVVAHGLNRAGLAVYSGNPAMAFYRRLGYRITGNDGPNAVEMEKVLANNRPNRTVAPRRRGSTSG
jgi:GNAT superfamily N-acetyltransferase